MSDQIIVATFNNTNAAYDAAAALKALKDKGITDFKPKAGVMVKKDDKGNLSLVESKERPLWGTGIGTLGGALIGLIGGAPGALLRRPSRPWPASTSSTARASAARAAGLSSTPTRIRWNILGGLPLP